MATGKITINITSEDQLRLEQLRSRFPFATKHALVVLAFREGLDAGAERLVERLARERKQETMA